jgi:hypothetical protein
MRECRCVHEVATSRQAQACERFAWQPTNMIVDLSAHIIVEPLCHEGQKSVIAGHIQCWRRGHTQRVVSSHPASELKYRDHTANKTKEETFPESATRETARSPQRKHNRLTHALPT